MENYIVSARKYRPISFDTVVGQGALTTTLKNAIKSGRLAHAYLFCGPRGVGKTTCARIFAKTINCLNPAADGEACGECESCRAFNEQRSYNIHELDAASNNSVEDIRSLIDQVRIPPQVGKYKVFIIDEVHMLSTQAFNAFLKTLEEPPHHAIFILATTEKHKLLPTILSRCQIYDFSRMSVENIVGHLTKVAQNEGITAEPAALNVIAQKADGGMRDALSIFDQVASFCGGNITYQRTIENLNVLDYDYYFRLTDFCLENKITDIMLTFNEILNKGFDGQHFITGFSSHLRDLLVSKDPQTTQLIEASDDVRQKYQQQAQKCQQKFLYNAMRLCNDCDLSYKQSQNKRLLVELTLIEIAQVAQGEDVPSSGRRPKKILKPIFAGIGKTPVPASGVDAKNDATPQQQGETANTAKTSNDTVVNDSSTTNNSSDSTTNGNAQKTSQFHPAKVIQNKRTVLSGFSIKQAANDLNNSEQKTGDSAANELAADVKSESKLLHLDTMGILTAWHEYANKLPKEHKAMTNRMMNIEPTLLDGTNTIEIIADNPTVESEFNRYLPFISNYLKQRIDNKDFTMTVRMRKVTDKKRALSRGEALKLLCEQNEGIKKLVELFNLELR